MVVARQGNPSRVPDPFVTGVGPQSEADEAVHLTSFILDEVKQLAHDDIGARNGPNCRQHTPIAASPLTTWSISIGCIAAPTEIFPMIEPASDGRPSALANCFEIRSRPPVMPNDSCVGIVIVIASFNIKKGEPGLAVAHGKTETLVRRKFFDYELLERRA